MLSFTTTCLLVLAAAAVSSSSLRQQSFVEFSASASVPDNKRLAKKNVTTTTTTTPQLSFTTNTTKIWSGRAIAAACNISNFAEHASRNYSVSFCRRSQELDSRRCDATYTLTVTPSGVQSVVFKTQPYIKIHSGAHFAYPSFEVVFRRYMKQSEDELLENYWCELVVLEEKEKEKENVTQQQQQQQKPKPLVSNVWVNTPLVRLVISGPLASDPTNRTFVASCQITHLEQSLLQQGGPEFTVKLLITEDSYYNELAHFQVPVSDSVAKSRPVEFNINYIRDGRQVVSQGDGVALPTFDFIYRNEANYEPYYFACRLEQPFSNWKQVTSNQVRHF